MGSHYEKGAINNIIFFLFCTLVIEVLFNGRKLSQFKRQYPVKSNQLKLNPDIEQSRVEQSRVEQSRVHCKTWPHQHHLQCAFLWYCGFKEIASTRSDQCIYTCTADYGLFIRILAMSFRSHDNNFTFANYFIVHKTRQNRPNLIHTNSKINHCNSR